MKLSNNAKRLGIFIFFDKDCIVDDYVIYMLKSIKAATDELIFVSNSKIEGKELDKVKKFTDKIELRENKGLDAGAFKYVFDKYGVKYLRQFDEVILLNDTFYGPFKPFKEIINDMSKKDLDFWGLTANYECLDGSGKTIDGYIRSHIQTYFVAFRNSVLSSDFFYNYWKKYKINRMKTFDDVVYKHETYFTYLLESHGFKWDTYVNLKHYKSTSRKCNYNIYGYSAYSLLKYYNCPFIKRKNFVFPKDAALYINSGIDTKMALDYIKGNTNYDVNMIYKNLVRLYHPVDLYHGLNMNFVVDEASKANEFDNNTKNCIFINISDRKLVDIVNDYVSRINNSDIILVTDNNIKMDNIICVDDSYKYLYSIKNKLIRKYDNICVIDIEKQKSTFQERIDSDIIRIFENSIKNDEYINGVVNIFNENKYIEALFMPCSIHHRHFNKITRYDWRKMFYSLDTKKLSEFVNLNYSNFMVKTYKSVWMKTALLKTMPDVDMTLKQYVAILHEFVSNDKMMVGKVYSKDFIENDIISYEFAFRYIINTDKIVLSFPDRLLSFSGKRDGIIRRTMRRIIPYNVRKKITSIKKK